MSTVVDEEVPCPSCSATTRLEVAYSLHAVRRPEHRQAVLDDTLQRVTCPACGEPFRASPQLVYLDTDRGLWIMTAPAEHAARWSGFEAAAVELFDESFGPQTPAPVAAVGRTLRPRVVFGWAALREKVLADALGVDDVELEALKAAVVLSGDTLTLDASEVRLVGGDDEALELARLEPATGRHLEALQVPRSLLDDVRGEAWATLRALVGRGLYVDVARVLTDAEAA